MAYRTLLVNNAKSGNSRQMLGMGIVHIVQLENLH